MEIGFGTSLKATEWKVIGEGKAQGVDTPSSSRVRSHNYSTGQKTIWELKRVTMLKYTGLSPKAQQAWD